MERLESRLDAICLCMFTVLVLSLLLACRCIRHLCLPEIQKAMAECMCFSIANSQLMRFASYLQIYFRKVLDESAVVLPL